MKKKLLATLLTLIMVLSTIPVWAGEGDTTVYVSVSKYGEIVNSKDNTAMAYLPVTLNGESAYNLDDVFLATHEEYFSDGAEGYSSANGDWGLYIEKLWGDESGNFGYQVNGGAESVSGLDFMVENGDFIDVCIYENLYPDTEGYAKFDKQSETFRIDEEIELTLSYVSGYDENWNSVFSPCEGATILINGEETDILTDENGKAVINVENTGSYVISAAKSKLAGEREVAAITAPVCVLTVKEPKITEITHGIAKEYNNSDLSADKGNLPWIIADMAVYESLFPESENILTDEKKSEALSVIAEFATETEKPGDIAKSILALRALGFDARNIYTKSFEKVDIVSRLTDMIDNGDSKVTNIYTLPYVIIALNSGEGYASEEQMNYLLNAAVESKDLWQSTEDGTDALTPMILALAPYYNTDEEIKSIVDETVEILKAEQREDGLIDGPEGYEPASTALAICALSSIGIDAKEVENGGENLVDGLMSTVNENLNAFPNAFATEQGFRAVLAYQLLLQNEGKIYNFKDYPMNEANIPGINYAPVIFKVNPSSAVVTISGFDEFSTNCFDLDEGSYSYIASARGYSDSEGEFEIKSEDAENKAAKIIEISLERIVYSGGGGGGGISKPAAPEKDEETVKEEDTSEEKENTETESEETKVLTGETFADVSENDWYYSSVKYAYENNLFAGTDKGFEPNVPMSRAMLVTVLHRLAAPSEAASETLFEDIENDTWYSEGVKWASSNGIITGITNTSFAPNSNITREQLAVIIYRYANFMGYDTEVKNINLDNFSDRDEISAFATNAIKYAISKGIMNGKGNNVIAPLEGATRAEVATMIMRFAEIGDTQNEE